MSSTLMKKLDVAFQKIDELSENEREVEINGQKIVLGIISGAEEEMIQAHIEERSKEMGRSLILRDVKLETTSYAIKAINDERIDKVDFFSVKDPATEKEAKIEKHIFLRNKLRDWAPFLVNYLFNQYAALIDDSSQTLLPKFEIEGLKSIEDLLRAEIEEQKETLKEVEESTEETPKPETVFREIPNPEAGGTLDQAGR